MYILAAEDNDINQMVIEGMLERLGHSVHIASDGLEAVKAYESHDFDLVFMDLGMPKIDGLEATRRIREIEKKRSGRHVPIIALTAHVTSSDTQACLEAGADGFLKKPVGMDDINNEILKLLGETR